MRDIEGIDRIVRTLSPHLKEIEENFDRENEHFKSLLSQDHELIGRVLKCHLIVENYLDRFLNDHINCSDLSEAKLTFFQKVKLLPSHGSAVAFVKPGINKLNSIRNRFGHTLQPELHPHDLEPMLQVLHAVRPSIQYPSAIEVIEAFTTVACTWLIVVPPHLRDVWQEAFVEVRTNL